MEGGTEIKVEGGKRGHTHKTAQTKTRCEEGSKQVGLTESQGNNGQPAERRRRECTCFVFFLHNQNPAN